MNRKASTVTNVLLLVGVLFIGLIISVSMKKLFYWQAKNVETDATQQLVDEVKKQIELVESYSQDGKYSLSVPYSEEYSANISYGRIRFQFEKSDPVESVFLVPNVNLISSTFSSSGEIEVYRKDNNIYVTNSITCNIGDEICDIGCIIEGECDSSCYNDNTRDNVCNPYCLDRNGNKKMDADDSDMLCDPDCYNNDKNGFFYDIDCVKSNDGICDPDSHNTKDGICDKDCLGTNGVCDPDCNDKEDRDCPHRGNGICEEEYSENCIFYHEDCGCEEGKTCKYGCDDFDKASFDIKGCVDTALVKKEDESCNGCDCENNLWCDYTKHCCKKGFYFKGNACVNFSDDNICTTSSDYFPGESCANNPDDCGCGTNEVCCPAASLDEKGCAAGNLDENAECECTSQCSAGLRCADKHCCRKGYKWDGNSCVLDVNGCEIKEQALVNPGCNCEKLGAGDMCEAKEVCCPAATTNKDGCVRGPSKGHCQQCECSTQCESKRECSPEYGVCIDKGDHYQERTCQQWFYIGNDNDELAQKADEFFRNNPEKCELSASKTKDCSSPDGLTELAEYLGITLGEGNYLEIRNTFGSPCKEYLCYTYGDSQIWKNPKGYVCDGYPHKDVRIRYYEDLEYECVPLVTP
ncbi:hypothetical protein JXA85_02765 [Candidatus Woesearchaeota archaeon]|nr:hypothetical protein [Candidatus Woesearchaeota archaeon]